MANFAIQHINLLEFSNCSKIAPRSVSGFKMATLLISSRSFHFCYFLRPFLDWQGHVTLSWKEPIALKPHALLAVKPNVFHFFLSTWFFFCHEYPWTLNSAKTTKSFPGKVFRKICRLLKVLKAFNRQIQKEKFGYALQGCPFFRNF